MTEGVFGGALRGDEFAGAIPLGTFFSAPETSLLANYSPGANLLLFHQIRIPVSALLSGLQVINGTPAAGNTLVGLYDINGNLLASSAAVAQTGTNVLQLHAFATAIKVRPGTYYAAVLNSSTGNYQAGQPMCPAGSAAQGGAAIPATITPPLVSARVQVPLLTTY